MKKILHVSLGLMALAASSAFSQAIYNAQGSSGGATGQALNQGGIGRDLGMTNRTSSGEMIAPDGQSEGFNPLGFLGDKPFDFTLSIREGFDSNVNTTKTDPQQSFYTNAAVGVSYSAGSPRFQLQSNLSLGYTLYTNSEVTDPDRFNGLWDLSALYTVTPRLTLSLATSTGYYSQPNVAVPGTNISQQGDYISSGTTFTVLYQWAERFSTTTSYSFNALVYVDETLNQDQGRITQVFAQAFNFLFWPTTTIVGEYRISPTTYFDADLNTLDQYFLVGWDHVFSPRASWNTRLGAQFNILDNPVDGTGTYIGPYGETALNYQYGQYSRLSFTMRYGTEAAGLNNVTQRQSFRAGIGVVQGWTPRLSFSGGLFYGVNYYDQANVIDTFYENIFEGNLGVNYEFNRFLSLSAGYSYTGVLAPEAQSREYNRNIIFVGLNTTF